MHAEILRQHPVSDDSCRLLLDFSDYFALPDEQANATKKHVYERLTNDAVLEAILALELSLRHRLGGYQSDK